MFIVFIFLVLIALAIIFKKRIKMFFNPVFWLGLAWVITGGLYFTSGIEFKHSPNFLSLSFFILVFLFFLFGFCSAKNNITFSRRNTMELYSSFSGEDGFYNLVILVETFSLFVFLADFLVNNYGSNNLHIGSVLSKIGVLAEIICLSGLVVWIRGIIKAILLNKKIEFKSTT